MSTSAVNLYEGVFRYPRGAGFLVRAFALGGTTTPVSTFADANGNSQNPWPVVLAADSNGTDGIASVYVSQSVTIDIQDANGVTQEGYPADFIRGVTVADLQEVDQRLSERLDDHDDALFLLQSRASVLEEHVAAVEDRATDLEDRATSLESRATSLESRATSLEGRMSTAESNIAILDTEAEAASAAITALQAQMATANDNIAILDTEAEAASTAITTLQGQMTTATGNIATLQGQMVTANNAISTLQDQMVDTHNDVALLADDVEALQAAVNGLTLAVGGSQYSWDKESQTLTSWGTFSTASDGRTTVYYPLGYDVTPVVTLTTLSAGLFVTSTLTALDTVGFSVYACNIDGSGTHVMVVDGRWLAVGKKAA